ncbi:MAG: HigA family addiction module antidote protein [Alphaproteobacteria bacterium]|nr:HigA family addiction module antidote protein [Alphaproteobacteria bacterium]
MPRDHKPTKPPRMRPPHPGSILRLDVLPAMEISVVRAARELGVSRQLLHGIMAEKLPISADLAVRLGKWCGNDAHLWIALQRDFDLWQARMKLGTKLASIPTRAAA